MSETLIIAEKPSVAVTIAAALGAKEKKDGYIAGSGYLVSWCVGHLVQLAEAAAYGEQYKKWSYDSLPILPQEWQYAVASDKGKQFKILRKRNQGGLCVPQRRERVRPPLFLCPLQGKSRLDYRYQYDPPVFLPVWKDAECGARPDPDAQNACRPGRRHYHL